MTSKQVEISIEIDATNKRILELAKEKKMNYNEIDKLVIERYHLQKQYYKERIC